MVCLVSVSGCTKLLEIQPKGIGSLPSLIIKALIALKRTVVMTDQCLVSEGSVREFV